MIQLNDIVFNYKHNSQLFNGINLSLGSGSICGLLGKNGSGKTSLLNLIAGLVFPNTGSCNVLESTPKKRQASFLQALYFLPEEIYLPPLTATHYVKYYAPFYPNFDKQILNNCLKEFDLPINKLLTELSQGQKKKFLISFGLATNCRLLLLDEPTNGLDIPSKAQFRKLLATHISDEKLFIISTHQIHDVENLIDTVVILDEGKIIFNQTLAEISQRLAFVQLQTEPDPSQCFYYEKQLGGYTAVVSNQDKEETHIDLEILFNTISFNKDKIAQYFSRG